MVDFNTPYSYCSYQGVSVGWGDDYYAGLDCQWIDVTGVAPGQYNLAILLNPDLFLCEGVPILDAQGNLTFVMTNFTSSSNETVYRQACNFTQNFDANNNEQIAYNLVGINSIVTLPCKREATVSPTKDCGFELKYDNLKCEPGQVTRIVVKNVNCLTDAVVRVCETSHALGHSIQCEYVDRLANVVLAANDQLEVSFKCPSMRSGAEPGGLYSVLVASLLPKFKTPTVELNPVNGKFGAHLYSIFCSVLGFFNSIF